MPRLHEGDTYAKCALCDRYFILHSHVEPPDSLYCFTCRLQLKSERNFDKLLLIEYEKEQSMQRNVQELGFLLRTRRSIVIAAASVEDIELWRKAARIAGRRLGVIVRTGEPR